jgi:N-acetylneuraminic acid mutarotase
MALVAAQGKLYAIGGRFNTFAHNTSYNEAYDPVRDTWEEMQPLPTARSGCAAALFYGRILVIGGERNGGVFVQNEAYDPSTNRWTALTPLPEGRHGTGAAVIGNFLYVPAGAPVNGGSQQSSSLLIFTE